MTSLRLKRVFKVPAPTDGLRVLVDRLWPRGLSKSKASINYWARELAPSDALRRWFGHDPAKWMEFRVSYFRELDANAAAVESLARMVRGHTATLVFAARDEGQNNATALREYLTCGRWTRRRVPDRQRRRKR